MSKLRESDINKILIYIKVVPEDSLFFLIKKKLLRHVCDVLLLLSEHLGKQGAAAISLRMDGKTIASKNMSDCLRVQFLVLREN